MDTETTGLDAKKNSLIQIAGIVEINGQLCEEVNLLMRPPGDSIIDQEALKVNGRTVKEMLDFPPADQFVSSFSKILSKYIDRYDTTDKFVCAGYNVNFDIGFLREAFVKAGDPYYGSWFFNVPLDIWTFIAIMVLKKDLRLKNYKLTTVCEHYRIQLEKAHNPIYDIRATRMLYLKCLEEIYGAKDYGSSGDQDGAEDTQLASMLSRKKEETRSFRPRGPRYNRSI